VQGVSGKHNILQGPLIPGVPVVSNELQWYRKYSLQQRPLFDGDVEICKDAVAAIKGPRGAVWFGRVMEIDKEEIKVQYFDCTGNGKWFELLPYKEEKVSRDAIICNGVQLRPSQKKDHEGKQHWRWKLLIPRATIKAMDSDGTFTEKTQFSVTTTKKFEPAPPLWTDQGSFLQLIDFLHT
jgi:hypothetical protein